MVIIRHLAISIHHLIEAITYHHKISLTPFSKLVRVIRTYRCSKCLLLNVMSLMRSSMRLRRSDVIKHRAQSPFQV